MNQKIKVIQIGLGGFGRGWAAIAREAVGIELVAVVDAASDARQWATTELGLSPENCHASLDQALTSTVSDAVLVITPPETHHALATAALRAGKHVLVEKPLATMLPDARSLIDTTTQAGRILMVSQNYRFRAPARAVQHLVAGGALGNLIAVNAACRRDTRANWPPDNFRYHMAHPYVLDMAIHHFDLIRALTGRNVRRIHARSWPIPDSPYRGDPAMAAIMELDGGIPVVFEGSWATHGPETSWNGDWEFIGDAGRLTWTCGLTDTSPAEITLQRWNEPPHSIEPPFLRSSDRSGTLQAFRTAIITGEQPETSGQDNINSLALVLACVQSIESGEPVTVADLLDASTPIRASKRM